jgi:hypothetical protein
MMTTRHRLSGRGRAARDKVAARRSVGARCAAGPPVRSGGAGARAGLRRAATSVPLEPAGSGWWFTPGADHLVGTRSRRAVALPSSDDRCSIARTGAGRPRTHAPSRRLDPRFPHGGGQGARPGSARSNRAGDSHRGRGCNATEGHLRSDPSAGTLFGATARTGVGLCGRVRGLDGDAVTVYDARRWNGDDCRRRPT